MPNARVQEGVQNRIAANTLNMSTGKAIILKCAHFLQFGLGFARKVRLFRKPSHIIPHMAGQLLELAVGDNEKVQKAARLVLGAKAIVQCTEDLLELEQLGRRCRNLLRGKEYVLVRGNRWDYSLKGRISPALADKWRWFWTVYMQQLKQLFIAIGEIFKKIISLACHLSDAYTAYNGNCVASVFIHSKQLWHELSSDKSVLVKHWKETQQINRWMLKQLSRGLTLEGGQSKSQIKWSTFMNGLALSLNTLRKIPNKIKNSNVKLNRKFLIFIKKIQKIGHGWKRRYLHSLNRNGLIYKISPALVPKWKEKCYPFEKGDSHRFMIPPVRMAIV